MTIQYSAASQEAWVYMPYPPTTAGRADAIDPRAVAGGHGAPLDGRYWPCCRRLSVDRASDGLKQTRPPVGC